MTSYQMNLQQFQIKKSNGHAYKTTSQVIHTQRDIKKQLQSEVKCEENTQLFSTYM